MSTPEPRWRERPGGPPQEPPQQQRPRPRWAPYVVGLLVLLTLNYYAASSVTETARPRVPYSPFFLSQVRNGNVSQITSTGSAIQGSFRAKVVPPGRKTSTKDFKTEVPAFANTDALSKLLQQHNVTINAKPLDSGAPWWENLLLGFGPTILFVFLLFWLARRASGLQGGMLSSFGRSRARRYQPGAGGVTFNDVAGIDEAKEELHEVVDFLRNPDKYRRLGGRIPRGVLLSGPPGTGKTLLARAVAGEAEVPFFSMSASEFIEAIVGIGASRVRDLFAQAKEAAPSIIFIDELDTIGRARGGPQAFGGNDEREQTLNQILTEMDGFDSSTSVIVLAATNRPDILDSALLRPGRFDRRIAVQPPDRPGRAAILAVHTRSVPLDPDVDLDRVAASTPGMVGTDLANLVNEAALLAARRNHDKVKAADFADALEKVVLGAERKVMMSPADRRLTAYHEGGHAIVGMLTPGADPVRKVSIIPRGRALGVTFSAPDADRYNYQQRELIAKIEVALGGRAAEDVVFGEVTTGAESDLQQATQIARQMVTRWGMSREVGLVTVDGQDGAQFAFPQGDAPSERTREIIDEEVKRIIDECYAAVTDLLRDNRHRLDSLADQLLAHETLDQDDAYRAAGVEQGAVPEVPQPAAG